MKPHFKKKTLLKLKEMRCYQCNGKLFKFPILTMQHFNRHCDSLLEVSFYVADFQVKVHECHYKGFYVDLKIHLILAIMNT